jgi:hypothetical protein
MLANKRIAIVIQGPIISAGNSGAGTLNKSFDCASNIQRLLDESQSIVDGYVLSTWHGQTINLTHPKLRLVQLRDPGPQRTFFSDTPSNEFRQAYGCHEGIKSAIEHFSPDYVVKVRTDQYIDIVGLVAHMLAVDSSTEDYRQVSQEGFLYLPNMLSWSPYSVGDFYVGGHARDLLDFFEAQVLYSKHSFVNVRSWVHSDIVLRHAYRNLKGKLDLPDDYFFPNIAPAFRLDMHAPPAGFKYHLDVLNLWSEILRKSLSFYPREIAAGMEWRGSLFALSSHSSGEFYEEWLKARVDPRKWIAARQPKLYGDLSPIGRIDRFINFNPEKAFEIESRHPTVRRHLYRVARFFLSLLTGQFPRDELAIRLWLRLKRLLRQRNTSG